MSQRASMLLERLVRREAHVLLLQRQPQLVAERAPDAPAATCERAAEAQARLDRHHEQVDELGQLVVDLLERAARAGCARSSSARPSPTRRATRRCRRRRSSAGQPRLSQPARDGGGHARRHRAPGSRGTCAARCVYMPGGHQLVAQLALRAGRRAGGDMPADQARDVSSRSAARTCVSAAALGCRREAVGVDLAERLDARACAAARPPATRSAPSPARRRAPRSRMSTVASSDLDVDDSLDHAASRRRP